MELELLSYMQRGAWARSLYHYATCRGGTGHGTGITIQHVEGGLGSELVLLSYMQRGPGHGAGITILHVEGGQGKELALQCLQQAANGVYYLHVYVDSGLN